MISRSLRSGQLRQNLSGNQAYFSFLPAPLPPAPAIKVDSDMEVLLRKIHIGIGYLKGLETFIPNKEFFQLINIRKEALFSSQVEGSQATLDDLFDSTIDENANRDISDVIDNVHAVSFAVKKILDPNSLPLCMRLLREAHEVLLTHSRGRDKNPGQFRSSQNWIGPTGCTLTTASYVPPNLDDMNKALSDLENFIHSDNPQMNPFIKVALIHYQFETIHPFLDGNGRIGRLLILLYLIHAGVLASPLLYISYFLKLHRSEYYDLMMNVRQYGNYEEWVKFFLKATDAAITDTTNSIQQLCSLHSKNHQKILDSTSRVSTQNRWMKFLSYLEHNPIIEIKLTAQKLDLSFPTTSKLVMSFLDLGILKEVTGRHRSRVFAYDDYLTILRKDSTPL